MAQQVVAVVHSFGHSHGKREGHKEYIDKFFYFYSNKEYNDKLTNQRKIKCLLVKRHQRRRLFHPLCFGLVLVFVLPQISEL